MTDYNLSCRMNYTQDRPALIIEFDPMALTLSEIQALSAVLEKTAVKWLNCQKNCAVESCDKGLNDGRRTEGARGSKTDHSIH